MLAKQLEATVPLGQLLVQMGTLDAELARFHAEGEAMAG